MEIYPPSLENLIEQFSRLPGIGKKSASRLALFVLKSPKELAESLAQGLIEVKEKIKFCPICFEMSGIFSFTFFVVKKVRKVLSRF